jgi:hypothetical protein
MKRIEEITIEELKEILKGKFKESLMDFGQKMTPEEKIHLLNRISYFMHTKKTQWYINDIDSLFINILDGTFDVKKLTVANMLKAINQMQARINERNKFEIEKKEDQENKNIDNFFNTSWYAQALRMRLWDTKLRDSETLEQTAKRLELGEIKFSEKQISEAIRKHNYDTTDFHKDIKEPRIYELD